MLGEGIKFVAQKYVLKNMRAIIEKGKMEQESNIGLSDATGIVKTQKHSYRVLGQHPNF